MKYLKICLVFLTILSCQRQAQKADFVILIEDIIKIDPVLIKNIKVLQTYVGGVKLFDSEE